MSETREDIKPDELILTEHGKKDLQKATENLVTLAREVGSQFHQFLEAFEGLIRQNAPLIAEIIRSLSAIPTDFLSIQQSLSERGWFVLAEMPLGDYRALKGLIDSSRFDDLDRTMTAWTLHLLDDTEKKLCELFPDRKAILHEGFDNHRTEKYASAITLLLTQADGICFDILEEIFFKIERGKGVPAVKKKIHALGIDAFAEITLHPILIKAGINASDVQIKNGEYPDSPHRHPILHGKVNDYSSELNSLKIISFVGYLGGVVHGVIADAKQSAISLKEE